MGDLVGTTLISLKQIAVLNSEKFLFIKQLQVSDLSVASGIAEDDIISTLQTMQLIKYWKGDHVVRTTRRLVEHCRSINIGRPPRLRLDPNCLKWWPRTRHVNTNHDSKLGAHHLK